MIVTTTVSLARGCDNHGVGIRAVSRQGLAWLAWQDGRREGVIELAEEIGKLEVTAFGAGSHNKWVYLWPLLAVHLAAGQLAEAIAAGGQLLHATQHRLPAALESALRAAISAWEAGPPELTGDRLTAVLTLARDLRYC